MPTLVHDDIADLLTSGGITTSIFRGFLPERPDEAIQVVVTGGYPAVHAFSASAGQAVEENPSVQILRRSASLQRALVEMNVIWKMLDGFGDRAINGTQYKWAAATQSPTPIGRDESDRSLVVCNFVIAKAISTATST